MNTNCGSQNNVYIGARYVPRILGEWSADMTYEPLDVVLYQGTSYTSRTYVPKGIIPSESTQQYWALTGNYNAQVEMYRQEVAKLQNSVIDLENVTLRTFNTTQDILKADLSKGEYVKSLGYKDINDNGGAVFLVDDTLNEDNTIFQLTLENGLYIDIVDTNNVACYGILPSNSDNSQLLQKVINYKLNKKQTELYFPNGEYNLTNPITIDMGQGGFWDGYYISIVGESPNYTKFIKTTNNVTQEINTMFYLKNGDTGSGVKFENLTLTNNGTSPAYCIYGEPISCLFINLNLYGDRGIYCNGYSNVFKNIIGHTENTLLELARGTSSIIERVGAFSTNNPYIIQSTYSTIDVLFGDKCTGIFLQCAIYGNMNINTLGAESPNLTSLISALDSTGANNGSTLTINNIYMFGLTTNDVNYFNVGDEGIYINNLTINKTVNGTGQTLINFAKVNGNFTLNELHYSGGNLPNEITISKNQGQNNVLKIEGNYLTFNGVHCYLSYYGNFEQGNNVRHIFSSILANLYITQSGSIFNTQAQNIGSAFSPNKNSILVNDLSASNASASPMYVIYEKGSNLGASKKVGVAPLLVGASSLEVDPALLKNGMMWLDLTTSKLKIYCQGAWKSVQLNAE